MCLVYFIYFCVCGVIQNHNFLSISIQSAAMVEQAIQMALQPSHVYHKMQMVFLKYEEGKLKGQKVRELKGLSLQKALEGRYAAKLPQFKVFQGLKVPFLDLFIQT